MLGVQRGHHPVRRLDQHDLRRPGRERGGELDPREPAADDHHGTVEHPHPLQQVGEVARSAQREPVPGQPVDRVERFASTGADDERVVGRARRR